MWNTPFWRRAFLAGLGVVAFYKFAPAPGDDTTIAKYISKNMSPAALWDATSFSHLIKSAERSDEVLLVADAKPPTIHRYRFPQCVEPFPYICMSANCTAVSVPSICPDAWSSTRLIPFLLALSSVRTMSL